MAWVDIENLELLLSVRNKLNTLGALVDQLEQDIIDNDGEISANAGNINTNANAITSINNQLSNHIGQGGESNHALATDAEDGFMSKEHYTKLQAITPVNYASLTDPASGAITTSMVDNNGGVLVTVTGPSNALTISNPTLPTNRPFTVTNSSTSVEPILVDGTSIKPGSKAIFVWDSSSWADGKDYLLVNLTDPAAAAITQNIVDKYNGVLITTTTDGDDLTIAAPSDATSGKKFTVIVASASTHIVNVEGNPVQIDESVEFTWTGSSWKSDPLALQHKSMMGTGVESGLEISATLGGTTFDVSEGYYYYVDNYTDRAKPISKRIYYAGSTGNAITNIASAFITFITIDKNATIKQYTTLPDARVDTYEVVLGAIGHSNLSTITSVSNTKRVPSFNLGPRLYSLFSAILPIPSDDNDFGISAAATDLTIERAAGTEVFIGNNPSDDQLPDRLDVAAQDPVTNFITFWRDGASGWNIDVSNSAVTPSIYDNNTTSPSAPVGAVATNKWTVHRFFFSPGSGNAGLVMQYGQHVYDSKDNALNALTTESFELYPPLKDTLFRTWLVIKGGCTDLSDTSQAVFINVPKFGGAGGAGTTTNVDSQDAYNNSPDGNVTTDGVRGSVKFQQGSGADTDTVVEVLNGAGTTVASITGEGTIETAGNIKTTEDLIVEYSASAGLKTDQPAVSAGGFYHYNSAASNLLLDARAGDGTSDANIKLFRYTNTTGAKRLQLHKGDNSAAVDIELGVDGRDSYFNSGGNVAVGTTSATYRFTVEDNSSNWVSLFYNTDATNGYGLYIRGGASDGSTEALRVQNAAGVNLFNVMGDGLVGLQTNTPDSELHVRGTNAVLKLQKNGSSSYFNVTQPLSISASINHENTAGNSILDLNPKPTNGVSDGKVRVFRDTNTTGVKSFDLHHGDGTAGISVRLGVDGEDSYFASGDVGIGTTENPLARLQVQKDGVGEELFRLRSNLGASGNRSAWIESPDTDSIAAPFRFNTNNSWAFAVDGTDALTIDDAGNVGIGTGATTPSAKLEVDGVVVTKSYTVATKPIAEQGGLAYFTDETGGSVHASGDGTDWRRSTDRAVIS